MIGAALSGAGYVPWAPRSEFSSDGLFFGSLNENVVGDLNVADAKFCAQAREYAVKLGEWMAFPNHAGLRGAKPAPQGHAPLAFAAAKMRDD